MLLADVAVPVPLGRPFSYEVPAALQGRVSAGMRVLCEFGPKKTLGVVLDVTDREPSFDKKKIKPIAALVDDEPVLLPELLGFLRELASYYLAPIGEVLRMALPALERSQVRALKEATEPTLDLKGRTVGRREVTTVRLVPTGQRPTPAKIRGRAVEILEYLASCPETSIPHLEQRWKGARAAVKRLQSLGLVELGKREVAASPFFAEAVDRDVPPALTPAQEAATRALRDAIAAGRPQSFLLYGVTGSGKTEVYLRAIAACLAAGR